MTPHTPDFIRGFRQFAAFFGQLVAYRTGGEAEVPVNSLPGPGSALGGDGCTHLLLSVLYGATRSRAEALSPRDGDSLLPHGFRIRHRRGAGAPYKSCSERVQASFPFFLPSVCSIFRRLATPR